ncbi:MAG TPA: hypothetical protein VFD85_05335 [Gemmatimonadales bacterium]|nr:hypothetical protein [Gemmatimonadales bacterium]
MKGVGMWAVVVWVLPMTGAAALLLSVFVAVVPSRAVVVERGTTGREAIVPKYPAESLGRAVTARDAFRADRRPAPVAYDPARGAAPLPDGPPKPQLVVTGIVWGEEPEAVMEGLPTTIGPRVVRVGDAVGGVTIKRIEQSRLVAVGFDTTWTLSVRVPWK